MDSEAIGCWDYDAGGRPTMINRYSGERVRLGRRVLFSGKRLGQRWARLDYLHDDLEFPVLVCWMPERGYIVVDYLASAALWRKARNSKLRHPPYGTWVRVDDCLLDAIWCWPGVLAQLCPDTRRYPGRRPGVVALIGGWCNGSWHRGLRRVSLGSNSNLRDTVSEYGLDRKHGTLDPKIRIPLTRLTGLEEPAPSPWVYVDAADPREHERLGYTHFEGEPLLREDGPLLLHGREGYQLPTGARSVAIKGVVPQMRSADGTRVLFPVAARISFGREALEPTWGGISFLLLEPGLTGVFCGWGLSRSDPDAFDSKRREASIEYRNLDGRIPSDEKERAVHAEEIRALGRIASPMRLNAEAHEFRFLDHVEVAWSDREQRFTYQTPGPWSLSAYARRRVARLLQDAYLFWQGTEERPAYWGSINPEILSYRPPAAVRIRPDLLGGMRLGYEILARLEEPRPWYAQFRSERPWTREGFKFARFL
ncbi:MAG: hypothetical protein QNJ30_04510 [Kiloniellales bacterium]|nr:hypothetical protein [Kiloniellales bacterium]